MDYVGIWCDIFDLIEQVNKEAFYRFLKSCSKMKRPIFRVLKL